MLLDLRILEILASKICHDLISPVGAINNGVELIEDIGPSVTEDAMKLISNSGQQAAKRLRMFRMAYGRAGAEGLALRDARNVEWGDEPLPTELAEKTGGLKVLLCTLGMAEDVLSHGGSITVESMGQGASIVANGSHATLSDAVKQALAGETYVEDPCLCHPLLCRTLRS
jgi:histidine phosphotransferase ChpT